MLDPVCMRGKESRTTAIRKRAIVWKQGRWLGINDQRTAMHGGALLNNCGRKAT